MRIPLLSSLLDLLLPRTCCVCGERLRQGEEGVCAACLVELPYVAGGGEADEAIARLFWGRLRVERAAALMEYQPRARSSWVVLCLKYRGRREVGRLMGSMAARRLKSRGFFEGIDIVVPVPLHRRRQGERGYNQSEQFAQGVAAQTGLRVEAQAVERSVYTNSQTALSHEQRRENVEGIFRVVRPELLSGHHLLLVDDVLTTGSTLISLGQSILAACGEGTRLSVLTLSAIHRNTLHKADSLVTHSTPKTLPQPREEEVPQADEKLRGRKWKRLFKWKQRQHRYKPGGGGKATF